MIRIKATNNLTLADSLGGYMSLQDFPVWQPVVDFDTMRCLFIDSFRLPGGIDATRAEFTITKSGSDFTLSISYPATAGWVDLADIEFTLAVGETYQSTYELGDICIRRILTGLDGTMTGRITVPYNTPLGGDPVDAGDTVTRYGCIFFVLEDATYIKDVTSYGIVEGVATDAACQIDLMADGLNTQTIASTTTAPTGLTWTNTETIDAEVPAGNYVLWYKTISSGAVGEITYVIEIDQDTGGNQETLSVVGKHRRYDNTLEPYVVYGAYDGSTIEGTLINEFSEFPADIILELPVSGTRDYLLRVVEQSKYGIESQNVLLDQAVSVTDAGVDATVPQTPSGLELTFLGIGYPNLAFNYIFDTKEQVISAQVEIDGVVVKAIPVTGFATYNYRYTDLSLWGESVTARVRFLDRYGRQGEWATVTETCSIAPASMPLRTLGGSGGLAATSLPPTPFFSSHYDGDAALISEPGRVSFYYNGALEFYAQWNTSSELILYFNGWKRVNGAVSGAQTSVLADAGGGIVYISDGTNRRVKLDTTAKTFEANHFSSFLPLCRREDAAVTVSGVTYFMAYPTTINAQYAPQPWIAFDSNYVYLPKYEQP
jgi:hypothetical protein